MLYINNFLKYNIIIGHNKVNSLTLSSWFFYKLRSRIWIINIFKTILFLKLVLKFLKYLVANKMPFWFINLEFSKEFIFKKYALDCGEYSCTRIWIRGFLSNFKSIQNAIGKHILKKEIITNEIKILINSWTLTRFSWPRGAFLSNIPANYVVCKEAGNIGLPIAAMVDTNIKSYLFSYPIPSNDDAIDSVCYIIGIISKQILLLKYKNLMLWYNKYKIKNVKILKLLKFYSSDYIKQKRRIKRQFGLVKIKYLKNYFFTKLMRHKYWTNLISSNLLGKLVKFKKNMQILNRFFTFNMKISKKGKFIKYGHISEICDIAVFYNQLKLISKMNNKQYFYKRFLRKYSYTFMGRPKKIISNTIKLHYLSKYIRKKKKFKNAPKFYFNYFTAMNIIKKIRNYYDSFFINLPSDYTFVRRFHLPQGASSNVGFWKNKEDKGRWYSYEGHFFKKNNEIKIKWLNNKFNQKLLEYIKHQKNTRFCDSAIIINIMRWVKVSLKISIFRKFKRNTLSYWLYPFFKKFSIKEGYRWYQAFFWHKEDKTFNTHFKWKLLRKTPFSALRFYSNWFSFMLKKKRRKYRRFSRFKNRRTIYSYVF